MATNFVNGKKQIVYARIADIITKNDITQKQFTEKLSEMTGKNITQANTSLWATGKRKVPLKYLQVLSEILNVSDAYLLGMTDDPQISYAEVSEAPVAQQNEGMNYEILYSQLYAYDKCPVFIVFPNIEYEDAWSIYDRDSATFFFANDLKINEKQARTMNLKYYISDIRKLDDPLNHRKALDYRGMMENENIYIHMHTSDRFIHGKYDGWYKHNEDHSALINESGLVLPYSGLREQYIAYTYNDKVTYTN